MSMLFINPPDTDTGLEALKCAGRETALMGTYATRRIAPEIYRECLRNRLPAPTNALMNGAL